MRSVFTSSLNGKEPISVTPGEVSRCASGCLSALSLHLIKVYLSNHSDDQPRSWPGTIDPLFHASHDMHHRCQFQKSVQPFNPGDAMTATKPALFFRPNRMSSTEV